MYVHAINIASYISFYTSQLQRKVTAYEAVKYTLENSEDQRCLQAMHTVADFTLIL